MQWKDDHVEFESTGRLIYCFQEIIGIKKIEKGFCISYGADGALDMPDNDNKYSLTADERKELADHMVTLWTEYGELNA